MGLYLVPDLAVDNARVFAWIGDPLVNGFADIDGIVEQLVEYPLVDQLAVFVANAFLDQLPGPISLPTPFLENAERSI